MSYFVTTFDPSSNADVLAWMREDYDSYDPWGWCMSWLFDLAGELYTRNICIPELQYQPGTGGPDVSEDRQEGLALIPDAPLIHAATLLNRYDDLLRRQGMNY